MHKEYYIYEVTCTHPDYYTMKYIGSHYGGICDGYIGSGSFLQAVRKQIGRKWFSKRVVEICSSLNELLERESHYLSIYDCAGNKGYFNLSNNAHFSGTAGSNWYYCPATGIRVCSKKPPKGFLLGSNSDSTKGYIWVYQEVEEVGKFVKEDAIPEGYLKGNIFTKGRVPHNKGVSLPDRHRSKIVDDWEVTHPDGRVESIENMLDFCRTYALNPSAMSAVARGKRRMYKGYHCKKLTNRRDVEYSYKEFVPCDDFSFRGRAGYLNNNAKPITIGDVEYGSMVEAMRATGLSMYKLRKLGEIKCTKK